MNRILSTRCDGYVSSTPSASEMTTKSLEAKSSVTLSPPTPNEGLQTFQVVPSVVSIVLGLEMSTSSTMSLNFQGKRLTTFANVVDGVAVVVFYVGSEPLFIGTPTTITTSDLTPPPKGLYFGNYRVTGIREKILDNFPSTSSVLKTFPREAQVNFSGMNMSSPLCEVKQQSQKYFAYPVSNSSKRGVLLAIDFYVTPSSPTDPSLFNISVVDQNGNSSMLQNSQFKVSEGPKDVSKYSKVIHVEFNTPFYFLTYGGIRIVSNSEKVKFRTLSDSVNGAMFQAYGLVQKKSDAVVTPEKSNFPLCSATSGMPMTSVTNQTGMFQNTVGDNYWVGTHETSYGVPNDGLRGYIGGYPHGCENGCPQTSWENAVAKCNTMSSCRGITRAPTSLTNQNPNFTLRGGHFIAKETGERSWLKPDPLIPKVVGGSGLDVEHKSHSIPHTANPNFIVTRKSPSASELQSGNSNNTTDPNTTEPNTTYSHQYSECSPLPLPCVACDAPSETCCYSSVKQRGWKYDPSKFLCGGPPNDPTLSKLKKYYEVAPTTESEGLYTNTVAFSNQSGETDATHFVCHDAASPDVCVADVLDQIVASDGTNIPTCPSESAPVRIHDEVTGVDGSNFKGLMDFVCRPGETSTATSAQYFPAYGGIARVPPMTPMEIMNIQDYVNEDGGLTPNGNAMISKIQERGYVATPYESESGFFCHKHHKYFTTLPGIAMYDPSPPVKPGDYYFTKRGWDYDVPCDYNVPTPSYTPMSLWPEGHLVKCDTTSEECENDRQRFFNVPRTEETEDYKPYKLPYVSKYLDSPAEVYDKMDDGEDLTTFNGSWKYGGLVRSNPFASIAQFRQQGIGPDQVPDYNFSMACPEGQTKYSHCKTIPEGYKLSFPYSVKSFEAPIAFKKENGLCYQRTCGSYGWGESTTTSSTCGAYTGCVSYPLPPSF